jgi:uncharacterized protein (TIGR02246 family)
MRELYDRLLDAWNRSDADAYAALFAEDGIVVGFDGSQMYGRSAIAQTLAQIFADHATGRYVGLVRSERVLGDGTCVVTAWSGLVPAGAADINPDLNAVQTLVSYNGEVVLFQNTPAQYHGRPDLAEAMTAELRARRPLG